jgi:hypothetical protein
MASTLSRLSPSEAAVMLIYKEPGSTVQRQEEDARHLHHSMMMIWNNIGAKTEDASRASPAYDYKITKKKHLLRLGPRQLGCAAPDAPSRSEAVLLAKVFLLQSNKNVFFQASSSQCRSSRNNIILVWCSRNICFLETAYWNAPLGDFLERPHFFGGATGYEREEEKDHAFAVQRSESCPRSGLLLTGLLESKGDNGAKQAVQGDSLHRTLHLLHLLDAFKGKLSGSWYRRICFGFRVAVLELFLTLLNFLT